MQIALIRGWRSRLFATLAICRAEILVGLQSDLTVVLTSCRRPDLLKRTLDSFFETNDYPLAEFIVIEDSDDQRVADTVASYNDPKLRLIMNGTNLGQRVSIDRAYAEVKTTYILHLEDDWIFPKSGIVEQGISILEAEPEVRLVQLRTERDTPSIVKNAEPKHIDRTDAFYHVIPLTADRTWHTFTFNPSVKRRDDYLALEGGYKRFGSEAEISIYYKEQRRPMAWLLGTGVDHIGWERSNFSFDYKPGLAGFMQRLGRFFSRRTIDKWARSLRRRVDHARRKRED